MMRNKLQQLAGGKRESSHDTELEQPLMGATAEHFANDDDDAEL